MTTFRKLCAPITLLVALSISALAGTIHTDAVPPPPPPPALVMAVQPKESTAPLAKTASTTVSFITEITLSFVQLFSVV